MSLAAADLIALWVQLTGTLLFCLVFIFLWRQSGVVYFGLWGGAWGAQLLAIFSGTAYLHGGSGLSLTIYALMQFAFAVLLISAARAGFSGTIRDWRGTLKALVFFPVYLAVLLALDWRANIQAFHATHAALVGAVYIYHFGSIRGPGVGGLLFRVSLLLLASAFFYQAGLYLWAAQAGMPPAGLDRVHPAVYYDFALHALLAFSAMAMWIESQRDRMRELEIGRASCRERV